MVKVAIVGLISSKWSLAQKETTPYISSMILWLVPKILLIYLFCRYVWHSVGVGVGGRASSTSQFSLSPM